MTSTADLIDRIDAGSITYWATLGIEVADAHAPGHVTLRLPLTDALGTRRPGIMHGGAIASLIDAAAGAATSTLREPDDETWTGQATLDLNVTFLSAATGPAVASATVLRNTRTLSFVQVDVTSEAGDLLAVGRATYTILRQRT